MDTSLPCDFFFGNDDMRMKYLRVNFEMDGFLSTDPLISMDT